MRATVEHITPEKAEMLLRDNEHNRKVSDWVVDKYAKAMTRGAWIENGAPIILSGDTLLDGQHRLHALIKSGINRDFVVVRDLDRSAFTAIDTGRSRNLKDMLTIEKKENAVTLSSAIGHHANFCSTGKFVKHRAHNALTYAELLRYNELHPQIGISVDFVCSFARQKRSLMEAGSVACLHALFTDKDPLLADEFIRKFLTGEDMREGDPVRNLREKLIDSATMPSLRMMPDEKFTAMILAWNATRSGVPLRRFLTRSSKSRSARVVAIK